MSDLPSRSAREAIAPSPTLKPLWRNWPEESWPVANVLCEGPSILALNPTELLLGPVIAINHALATPTPVDFWATSDNPQNLWAWSEPHRRRGLRYFTTDQALSVYDELLGDEIRRVYSTHMTVMDEGGEGSRGITILPTIVTVLAWLDGLGVQEVRLFGCDMTGRHSPLHSSQAFALEADDAHAWRWRIERALLAHAIRRDRQRGARIERWKPSRPRKTS
jgi:hypothetical protein